MKAINILFTSPGRRVELIEIFKANFPEKSKFYGVDFDQTSPASYLLDRVFKVPYKIDESYVKKILFICEKNKIDLLIPLIDPELPLLAKFKQKFKVINTLVMISDYEKILIANDKWETYQFCRKNNILIAKTCLPNDHKVLANMAFPIIAKPRNGSASKGILKIDSYEKLIKKEIGDNYLFQEFIDGDEITVDLFSDGSGTCYEIIQRKRLKIRGGEVERGVTIKNEQVHSVVEEIVKSYKPFGVVNLQFILKGKQPYLLEINPRFGGGYPLSYQAGANFPKRLLDLLLGKTQEKINKDYIENLYMFRYDNAVYTKDLIELC